MPSKTRPKRRQLTLNKEEAKPATITNVKRNVLQTLSINAKTSLVRNGEMTGRKFKIVPMVMIVEGVLNGSNGALMYPGEELGRTPESWDHKPVVVNHPPGGVSACSPEELSKRKVGYIFNTKYDKIGRLRAEAWIDIELANNVDARIVEAIENEEVMELSTGLFTDNEETPGTFDGVPYDAIARNYRPDHLALLPDQIGACSVARGAGFVRNSAAKEFTDGLMALAEARIMAELTGNYNPNQPRDDKGTFGEGGEGNEHFLAGYAALRNNISGEPLQNPHPANSKEAYQWNRGVSRAKWHQMKGIAANEMSLDSRRAILGRHLRDKFGGNKPGEICDVWVEDVFSDFFIYCRDCKLFSQKYSATGTMVELEGEPEEVVRVTEYRTPKGAFVGNRSTVQKQETINNPNMDKNTIINSLISNTESGWTEEDRKTLESFGIEKLKKLAANPAAKETPAVNAAAAPAPAPVAAAVAPAPAPVPAAPALNAEDKAALEFGKRQLAANRAKAIETIKANAANKLDDATLNSLNIDQLEAIAALAVNHAPVPAVNENDQRSFFGGQAEVSAIAQNAEGEDEALGVPTLNFEAKE